MGSIPLHLFEQKLKTAPSLSHLDKLLHEYMKSWHITGFTFTYYAPVKNKKNKLLHEISSPKLKLWHDYYHQENFNKVDQTQSETVKSLVPVFWETHQQLQEAKTMKDRRIRKESIKFGITKGLSLPVHGVGSEYAELTLRQFKNEHCLENWQVHKYEWHMSAIYYHHYLKFFLLSEVSNNPNLKLTPRERQCLNLLTQNYSTLEIAKQLNMTVRTVNFHIQNLNHKMGTRSKYQTVKKVEALRKVAT